VHCDFVKSGAPSLPVQDLKLQVSLDQNFTEAWSLSENSHSMKRAFFNFNAQVVHGPSFSSKTTLNHVPLIPNPGIQTPTLSSHTLKLRRHLRNPIQISTSRLAGGQFCSRYRRLWRNHCRGRSRRKLVDC
jgi:hypothetical protein